MREKGPFSTSLPRDMPPFSYERLQKSESVFQTPRNTLSGFCPKSGHWVFFCKACVLASASCLTPGFKEIPAVIQNPTTLGPGAMETTLDRIRGHCLHQTWAFQRVLFHTARAILLKGQIRSHHSIHSCLKLSCFSCSL